MKINYFLLLFLFIGTTIPTHDRINYAKKCIKNSLITALAEKNIPKIHATLPHIIDNLHPVLDRNILVNTQNILNEYYEEPIENLYKKLATLPDPHPLFDPLLFGLPKILCTIFSPTYRETERLRNKFNSESREEGWKRWKEKQEISDSLDKMSNLLNYCYLDFNKPDMDE